MLSFGNEIRYNFRLELDVMGVHQTCINLRGTPEGGERKGDTMGLLFELVWTFITAAVKAIAKVLVKKFFDKQKATLTSDKRNVKGSKSRDAKRRN